MPRPADLESYDLTSRAFVENPYPFYARLRDEDPVRFMPEFDSWWISRYADVRSVLANFRSFGSEGHSGRTIFTSGFEPPEGMDMDAAPNMLLRNPPDHTRLRGLVNLAFTPRVVERLKPHIEEIAGGLLDRVVADGHMDFVKDFAFPLPAIVIAELLGVPQEQRDQFRGWSNRIVRAVDLTQPPEARAEGMEAALELSAYLYDLIEQRRRAPQTDLLSDLLRVEAKGDKLGPGELLATSVLLLIAGHETTTNLLGAGVYSLLRHPDAIAFLRAHPEAMASAVEELLRHESPVQRTQRIVDVDTEVGGTKLRRGELVTVLLGAANHDPEVFSEPEGLLLTRTPNPHVAFGHGIHTCLGAPLARAEAQIALRTLLGRFPEFALDSRPAEWSPNSFIRGLRSLPVVF